MGGHAFHTSTDDGGNQYTWFLENYKPPTSFPKDAINAIVNNNNQPDFRSYGNPQGADFWQIWGKAGLVKREPAVSRQQRRMAKLNSFFQCGDCHVGEFRKIYTSRLFLELGRVPVKHKHNRACS